MFDTLKPTERRRGYLLLRDGHAIPLRGISPEEIKEGAKHRVLHPNVDPLRHRQTLNAIVDRLGFRGDFGTFQSTGWTEFQRFLKKNYCTKQQVGVFPVDHGGCIDLYFTKYDGPCPRQLADRIFESPLPTPKRVFLGYGVNWSAWDNGNGIHVPTAAIATIKEAPEQAAHLGKDLFARRIDLMGQWGFLDDKLVDGEPRSIVDKTYWQHGFDPREREESHAKIIAATRAFHAVFDKKPEGWVDILRYNERLVVLRANDGCWDLLWRSYREEEPPLAANNANSYELAIEDLSSKLMTKSDLLRGFHFRQEVWEEHEAHEAEQAFYDRGANTRERQQTSDVDVRVSWLREQGIWPAPERGHWSGPLPKGFHAAVLNGRKVAISNIVDVGSFCQMLIETGYAERRSRNQEPWERANEGSPENAPVGVSWIDAQAYCAWRERQLGVNLRLPTQKELRVIRPAYSKHYESMAFRDFPWENFPPRPLVPADEQTKREDIPSAVVWSEPRFVTPSTAVPEFPNPSGLASHSRKSWIEDFPPRANWDDPIPWVEHEGLDFIDAWDAYEWCQERGFVSGRFWEGDIAPTSWGAYKNMKVTFRVVMDIEG